MPANNKDTALGSVQADGTIYVGEVNGKKLYTEPQGSPLRMSFNEAAKYVAQKNKENYLGHNDWHLPTYPELNLLVINKDQGSLKGTFNEGRFAGYGIFEPAKNDFDYWVLSVDGRFSLNPISGKALNPTPRKAAFDKEYDKSFIRLVRTA
jgi:hypothetical protein